MIVKRCKVCGGTKEVPPRQRKCRMLREHSWSKTITACGGSLVPVKRKPAKRTLEQELANAHKQLANAITRVKRAVTSVDGWQRRIKSIGRRIDERDHPQPKKPRPVKRTRVIILPPDEAAGAE